MTKKVSRLLQQADVDDIDGWFLKHERDIVEMIYEGWHTNRALASIYLRDHAAASRTYTTVHQSLFNRDRVRTSVLVTGPIRFKQSVARGEDPSVALRLVQKVLTGAAYRHTVNGSRDTVMNTVRHSRTIRAYRRVGTGTSCAFCAMLIGRGAVYQKDTVAFQAHDRDDCIAEPEYRPAGTYQEPKQVRDLAQLWKDSGAVNLSGKEAIAAFRQAYKDQTE